MSIDNVLSLLYRAEKSGISPCEVTISRGCCPVSGASQWELHLEIGVHQAVVVDESFSDCCVELVTKLRTEYVEKITELKLLEKELDWLFKSM